MSLQKDTAHGTEGESTHSALRLRGRVPSRVVHQADALEWLATNVACPGTSVVTSLPDVSELGGFGLDRWRTWFIDTTRVLLRWIPNDGVAVFFQSDVRSNGAWVDKGYLVLRAAEYEGAHVVWHKIVCRRPPLTVAIGRPSYSHMICLSRIQRPVPQRPGPDVLPSAGHMTWSRAMGVRACEVACRFIRDETPCNVIVDPFCGRGTMLAVANAYGFDAIGVDLGKKRCQLARNLRLDDVAHE